MLTYIGILGATMCASVYAYPLTFYVMFVGFVAAILVCTMSSAKLLSKGGDTSTVKVLRIPAFLVAVSTISNLLLPLPSPDNQLLWANDLLERTLPDFVRINIQESLWLAPAGFDLSAYALLVLCVYGSSYFGCILVGRRICSYVGALIAIPQPLTRRRVASFALIIGVLGFIVGGLYQANVFQPEVGSARSRMNLLQMFMEQQRGRIVEHAVFHAVLIWGLAVMTAAFIGTIVTKMGRKTPTDFSVC